MNNKPYAEIEKVYNELVGATDEKLLALSGHRQTKIWEDTPEATNRIEFILNTLFDQVDRDVYYKLLGRKPISYNWNLSNRKKTEAILAILVTL